MKLKQSFMIQLEEKNERIKDLQKELGQPLQVQTFEDDFDPEEIRKIDTSKIKAEKYLTKEEREALEEVKRKEEERIRLMNQDDSGKRALQ